MRRQATPRGYQRGQMTVEFVFALLFLLFFVAAIMQALMFELDVFNKISAVRLTAFQQAHKNQDTTKKNYFTKTAEFASVGDLSSDMKIGKWELTDGLQYGDKNYYMREGTKRDDSLFTAVYEFRHDDWTYMLSVFLSHAEDTAKKDLIFLEYIGGEVLMPIAYLADDLQEQLQYGF